MTTDIDRLMSEDPTNLTTQDIDEIIAYHRNQRARKASGEKITKPKIDISAITQKLTDKVKAELPKIGRRI